MKGENLFFPFFMIENKTDDGMKYGLIGKDIGYSFSKEYFEKKFKTLGIDATYENISLNNIAECTSIFENDFNGINVTIPYKEKIIPFLDELSPEAATVGAVNTVKIKGGVKYGYNTDVYGFRQAIKPFFKSHHERAMILGTGGAAKAVNYVLENLGVNVIQISRTKRDSKTFGYEDINENMMSFNGIIVNTSPVGTYPNVEDFPLIPYEYFTEKHLAIDLTYNPLETLFLKKAKAKGAWTMNGLTMLHQQAEEAWKIWNNDEI
ncbi:shikimate dehydrogenase family protein [Crocinitomix algicola]|uniref:shikimate dehydrogenase family protein n=1 Tax=Crocinitomix algicola TaxID=1740263 RepID=UPI001FE09704|nr:shikimate dehydrogenase [Crocinitomix algicola]